LFDSLLIFSNTPNKARYIHLFKKKDYKFIASSGIIGKGPGEITNPFLAILDNKRGVIWCMDHVKRKIFEFPSDSILINSDYLPSYSVPMPSEKRFIIQYRPFNDKLFSFLNNEPNALISFFDHKGNIPDSLNIANKILFYEDSPELKKSNKILYIHKFHPSKDKLVIAFRYSDIIKILDKEGNILRSIQGPDKINEDPLAPLTESILAYFDVSIDKNYIYCLYQGGKRTKKENGQLISNFPHSLFIFDWDLNPIARINFKHSVSSFVIDDLNHRIVTFSPDFGDFVIYELPEL